MRRAVKKGAATLCVVALIASMLVVPASASRDDWDGTQNWIAEFGYYDLGGRGNRYSMPVNSTVWWQFEFGGHNVDYLSYYVAQGSANCVWPEFLYDDGVTKAQFWDEAGKTCKGTLKITPTSTGYVTVYVLVCDDKGNAHNVTSALFLNVW